MRFQRLGSRSPTQFHYDYDDWVINGTLDDLHNTRWICVRCKDPTDHRDNKGRCVVCVYELRQTNERKKRSRERRTPEQIAADKVKAAEWYVKNKASIQAYWKKHGSSPKRKEYHRQWRQRKREEKNA